MENMCPIGKESGSLDLPPGFRFHPTDEELITHYLHKKVLDAGFSARAIGDVDLNKSEPWELPWKAKMGEKEWYFFCLRDRKYPTGLRTNRATKSGYWKATGKDKEIYRGRCLVGMKKTLVFYKGRAPKGQKSNWVMHEYRLEGKFSAHSLPKSAKNEWVICRVFQKSPRGKKIPISGLMRIGSFTTELDRPVLPPLTESPSDSSKAKPEPAYVPCFSNPTDTNQEDAIINYFNSSPPVFNQMINPLPRFTYPNLLFPPQLSPALGSFGYSSPALVSDQSTIFGPLIENRQSFKTERGVLSASQETGRPTDMSVVISSVVPNPEMGKRPFEHQAGPERAEPVDLDSFWNY